MKRHYLIAVFCFFVSFNLNGQDKADECKCCTETHKQFDFWAGNWEVFQPDGTPAGANRIVYMQDNCLLQENWTSSKGKYAGTSYNFYNSDKKQWQQLWIDNQGGYLELAGNVEDGSMVMYSEEVTSSKGEAYVNRITWTPNDKGEVRQLWEVSGGEGENWKVIFDGIYRKE